MYNGTYRSKQHAVQAVSDTSLVEVGHLVAVDCENCDKEPLLGKVLKVVGEEVEIVWLEGEYSKSWSPLNHTIMWLSLDSGFNTLSNTINF